jgi:hypothetical protein
MKIGTIRQPPFLWALPQLPDGSYRMIGGSVPTCFNLLKVNFPNKLLFVQS